MNLRNNKLFFVFIVFFLAGSVFASVNIILFNSPADQDVNQNNNKFLNVSVYNNDTSRSMDVIIYGSNNSIISNDSIIFRKSNVTNATIITYNWTSPKIKKEDSDSIVLLMSFDNQTGEFADNLSLDGGMVLHYRFDNSSGFGENESLIFDFSNSQNNGSVIGGAFSNSTGKFSKAYQFNKTNYVDSGNTTEFNISNGLSLEGWFYPFGDGLEIGNISASTISSLQYDTDTGVSPDVIHISGDIYAVAYAGAGADGFLVSFNISNNGSISGSVIDSLEFDTSNGQDPDIIKVSDEIYAVAYEGAGGDGFVITANITKNGQISNSVLSSFEYDTSDGNTPDIININESVYAIVYEGNGAATGTDEGFIATINISSNGTITASKLGSFEFDSNLGSTPKIIRINNSVYAVAYTGPNGDGWISTLNISANGTITSSNLGSFEFDSSDGNTPDILHVSGDIYAIAYEGVSSDGFIVTLNISANGSILSSAIDSLEFDTLNGVTPDILHISGDIYAIAYEGAGADGFIRTLQIVSSGQISNSVLSSFEYDTSDGNTPSMIHVSGDTYAIAYEGNGGGGNEGFIVSLDIASDKGISQRGAYSLYSNLTMASGNINGQTLLGNVSSGWNHLALVYNKSLTSNQQKLYINGKLVSNGILNEEISPELSKVVIGNNYQGLIDEVSIYNRTLTEEEIRKHAGLAILDKKGINNGTGIYNNDNFNYSGKIGPALYFDGVEEVLSVNDSSSLDLTNDFSINLWIYPMTLSRNMTILSKGSSTTTNYYIDYKTTNKIEFGFYNGGFKSIAVDASSISANSWNLITATWNESSNISRVYINGVDKGSLQIDYDVLANALDLKVGYFPGYNQNFTGLIDELVIYNKTLNSTEISDIYRIKSQNWYWKFSAQDSNSINMSATRSFLVGNIWDVSPTALSSVGSALNVNVSVGTILINNTNSGKNITINITHDYNRLVYFNQSLPIVLYDTATGNNTIRIQINVTSPLSESSTNINFNITANDTNAGGDSVPASISVPVTLIASSSNPFLITAFETYPSVVSQNNTGIELKTSVVNKGQGNAQNVQVVFALPTGWSSTISSTQSLGILTVNEQKNASITVSLSSNASAGTVGLYANVSGQNSSGSILNSSYLTNANVNVSVNAISVGTGPSVVVETEVSSGASGGGGGSSSGKGGGSESVSFSKVVEVVRGRGESFDIIVRNRHKNSTLDGLTLEIRGYPKQYISITPNIISGLKYGEEAVFKVKLNAPIYKDYEVIVLKAIIKGNLETSDAIKEYLETQNIKLIIQAAPTGEAESLINEAKEAIEEMRKNGFNVIGVEKILADAESKFKQGVNKESKDLANKILLIKEMAFRANELIETIKKVLDDPSSINSLIGNAINGHTINGNAILDTEEINEVLSLAEVAFERGDYTAAFERAQAAKLLLTLEGKGNFKLFLYLYWHLIIISIFILSFISIVSYKVHVKSSISKKIEDLNIEEDKIGKLLIETQKEYFSGKMSEHEYHKRLEQYKNKKSKVQKDRLSLRNKRIHLMKPQELLIDLDRESKQIENTIKQLQYDYYRDRKLNKNEYEIQFNSFVERLAEIEEEKSAIELDKARRNVFRVVKPKKQDIKEISSNVEIKKKDIVRESLFEKIKKYLAERKLSKKSNGVMFLEHSTIEKIKSIAQNKDFKGKWIQLNFENSDISDRIKEDRK